MNRDILMGKISVALHAAAGLAIGFASFSLQNNVYAGGLGLIVLLALGFSLERLAGKKGLKWWLAHGVIIYLFLWLAGWVYALNA